MRADYGKVGVDDFLRHAANGNPAGAEFLALWHRLNHEVDDVVDEGKWDSDSILEVLMLACMVYSSAFYRQHAERLSAVVLVATNTWLDSCKWEKDPALWKRRFAEVMRHAGNDVVYTVAMITGGWEHLRKISAPTMAASYIHQKDKHGSEL